MVLATIEPKQELDQVEVIKTDNWELPVCNLGTGKYAWRPKTAFLPYFLFEGPAMTRRTHGIDLGRDLSIGVHGPRGSTKTLTLSYLTAKKLRMGKPCWDNWPVSFYVIEPSCWDGCQSRHCEYCYTGAFTYYENMPLDMDKVYTFNSELSEGAVGFTEFQYYVESRTSGKEQNRYLSYQIMQIRKSALSFYYDVQNQRWVDNRFGWSDDSKIFCRDVSKMNYIGEEDDIEEGQYSHWMIRDISGIHTGQPYEETGIEYGPYQFDGFNFWYIYPTRWKIDVYDAVNSLRKEGAKEDRIAAIGRAMELAVNSFLNENQTKVLAEDMWARASSLGDINVDPTTGGKVLAAYDVPRSQNGQGKRVYDLSVILESAKAEKDK